MTTHKELLEKQNKKITHSSASQIGTFRKCSRKWFYEKVKGMSWSGSKATRRGTAIHHGIEQFILKGVTLETVQVSEETGRVTDDSEDETHEVERFIEAAKPFLEDLQVIEVEKKMELATFPGGTTFLGYIDVLAADRILDWKTTTSLRYAQTPGDLLENPQAVAYAMSVFDEYPEADEFMVTFFYIHTANKIKVNTKPVTVLMTRAHCEAEYEKIKDDIRDMLVVAKETDPDKVKGNAQACMDFGGCPHRSYCNMKPEGILNNKPKHEAKPNPFTHPELFQKKKEKKIDNPSLQPPEAKDE